MAKGTPGDLLFKEILKTIAKSIGSFFGKIFSRILPGVRLPKFTKSLLEGILITIIAWAISYGFTKILATSALIAALGPAGAGAVLGLVAVVALLFLYYGIIRPSYRHYKTYQANLRMFQEDRISALEKIESNPLLKAQLRHGSQERSEYFKAKEQELKEGLGILPSIAPKLIIKGKDWAAIKRYLKNTDSTKGLNLTNPLSEDNKERLKGLLKAKCQEANLDTKTIKFILRALLYDSANPESPIPTSKLIELLSPPSAAVSKRLELMEAFNKGDITCLMELTGTKDDDLLKIFIAADLASRVNRNLTGGRLINGDIIEIDAEEDDNITAAEVVLKRGVELTYAQVCLFEDIMNLERPELINIDLPPESADNIDSRKGLTPRPSAMPSEQSPKIDSEPSPKIDNTSP